MARVRTRGAELGYEQNWPGGTRLRTSYSFQRSEDIDTGQTLSNSPRHMLKINATAPVWRDGEVHSDPAVQAHRCWEIALTALEELDGRVEDVVRTRMYVVDAEVAEAVGAVHGEVFGEVRPASTMVVVAGLLDPRWVVEIELDAIVG